METAWITPKDAAILGLMSQETAVNQKKLVSKLSDSAKSVGLEIINSKSKTRSHSVTKTFLENRKNNMVKSKSPATRRKP